MVLAAAILVLGVIVTVAPVISFANAAPTVTFAGGVPAVVTVDDPAAEPRIYLSATGGREFVGLPLRVSARRMPNPSGVPGSLVIEIVGFAGSSSVTEGDAVGLRETCAGGQAKVAIVTGGASYTAEPEWLDWMRSEAAPPESGVS